MSALPFCGVGDWTAMKSVPFNSGSILPLHSSLTEMARLGLAETRLLFGRPFLGVFVW